MVEPASPLPVGPSQQLCTACGLCCDGTLFTRGKLRAEERERIAQLGLPLIEEGTSFSLPCGRLDGCRCSIYAERPRICATFRCRLLEDVEEGSVPVPDARVRVATARAMASDLRDVLPEGTGLADARAHAVHFLREGMTHSSCRLSPDALTRSVALMLFLDRHFRREGKTDLADLAMDDAIGASGSD